MVQDISNYKAFQKKLMNLSEPARFEEINTILNQDYIMGLKLANAVIKNKQYLEILLEQGLEKANASDIEIWLKYLVPRLGFRCVFAILSKQLNSVHPQNVVFRPESVKKINLLDTTHT